MTRTKATEPPPLPPPPGLTLTVGFSGHRKTDADPDLTPALAAAFTGLRAVFEELAARKVDADETLAEALGQGWTARLLSGDAPGADRAAIDAWRAAGFERVHALYPYWDPATDAPVTIALQEAANEPGTRDVQWKQVSAWTAFDPSGIGLTGDQPHVEVGLWIVRHAEVLVAYWRGDSGRTGGTAEVVRGALARGMPVIWLTQNDASPRLIDPGRLPRRTDLSEPLQTPDRFAEPFSKSRLVELLAPSLDPPRRPPGSAHAVRIFGRAQPSRDPEIEGRRDYAGHDPLRHKGVLAWIDPMLDRSIWMTFAAFKSTVGGLRRFVQPEVPKAVASATLPDALAADEGYRSLRAAYGEADLRAGRLSSIHRSEQLLLIALATLAVVVSVAPNVAARNIELWHSRAAAAEFVLGLVAFVIRVLGHSASRHRRWADARRLAERLRAALLTWPLGADVSEDRRDAAHTWTEWRARAELRSAGPPTGLIDAAALRERTLWGGKDVVANQAGYHAKEHHLSGRIARQLKRLETISFTLLMAALAVFLLGKWMLPLFGWTLLDWVPGAVLVVSAASPAVAAASLTLETTLGLADIERRSEQGARDFRQLLGEIAGAGAALTLRDAQHMALAAAEFLVNDADAWRSQLGSRRLRQI